MAVRQQAILAMGDEPRKVEAYRRMIDTGQTDLVYRGLSYLTMYYRLRGRHDLAEQQIRRVTNKTQPDNSDSLSRLRPVFSSWMADDRYRSGDTEGAIRILKDTLNSNSSAVFLGEPFGAHALLQIARFRRSDGALRLARAAYGDVIRNHPSTGMGIQARLERGMIAIELGDLAAARNDLRYVTDAGRKCNQASSNRTPNRAAKGKEPCPDQDDIDQARAYGRMLDANRRWFRRRPNDLVAELKLAFEKRDVKSLDRIANQSDFKFGQLGAELTSMTWNTVRPFLRRVIESSPQLKIQSGRVPPSALRHYLTVNGLARQTGLPSALVLVVSKTPFGWQFNGAGGVFTKVGRTREKLTAGASGVGPRCSIATAPTVRLKAPWVAGDYHQAGGLNFDVDWEAIGWDAAEDVLDSVISFDHCGPSIPGFYYNSGKTHPYSEGEGVQDHYAIDFVDGYGPLACFDTYFWDEVCIPDPFGPVDVVEDLLTAISATLSDESAQTAGFGDPLLAAHAGLVVESIFTHGNGNPDHPNRIDLAIWPGVSPISAAGLLTGSGLCVEPTTNLGLRLKVSDAPYWLKHLHMTKGDGSEPSVGMWVQAGEFIGRVDDTGNSFMAHLHFVVRQRPIDEADACFPARWPSRMMHMEGRFLGSSDNGACIKSTNEVSLQDTDADGVLDIDDNCRLIPNPDQADGDNDRIGDACVNDWDNDGILNDVDSCPKFRGAQVLTSGGLREADFDGDGVGDICDDDWDGDGVLNRLDRCAGFKESDDLDRDGCADPCDRDDDADGWDDTCERPCGWCMPDLFPRDRSRAGDPDEDGKDSLVDPCPCRKVDDACGSPGGDGVEPFDYIEIITNGGASPDWPIAWLPRGWPRWLTDNRTPLFKQSFQTFPSKACR